MIGIQRSVARRLAPVPLVLLGITFVVFGLIHLLPGDPVAFYVQKAGTRQLPPELLERVRHEHRLDAPLPLQYLFWLRDLSRGELGHSYVDDRPVTEKVREAFPATLLLNAVALSVSLLIALPLGVWLGSRHRAFSSELIHLGLLLLYAVPTFWIALLAGSLFAVRWHLLPLYGMSSDVDEPALLDHLRHLVLPAAALALTQIAILTRLTSNAVSEALLEDHIRAARARGISEKSLLFRHAGRNALTPLISIAAVLLPSLLSGSVIIERMFQWNGVGGLLFDAVISRDYPVVMGVTLLVAVGVLLLTLLAELAYGWADPRVGRESEA